MIFVVSIISIFADTLHVFQMFCFGNVCDLYICIIRFFHLIHLVHYVVINTHHAIFWLGGGGGTIQSPGGGEGWILFKMQNFEQTPFKHVKQFHFLAGR